MAAFFSSLPTHTEVEIAAGAAMLNGILGVPLRAKGLVLFAHASGSSRHSARNQRVAEALRLAGLATLLFDLLTDEEERRDAEIAHLRFDIEFLADRLRQATAWALSRPDLATLPAGYFGASTGAAAALVAAAEESGHVQAVVSCGGRPDLAGEALGRVRAPTLLIVGGADAPVLELNRKAFGRLQAGKRIEVVPGAGHLFSEPGALEAAASLAVGWFSKYLSGKGDVS